MKRKSDFGNKRISVMWFLFQGPIVITVLSADHSVVYWADRLQYVFFFQKKFLQISRLQLFFWKEFREIQLMLPLPKSFPNNFSSSIFRKFSIENHWTSSKNYSRFFKSRWFFCPRFSSLTTKPYNETINYIFF